VRERDRQLRKLSRLGPDEIPVSLIIIVLRTEQFGPEGRGKMSSLIPHEAQSRKHVGATQRCPRRTSSSKKAVSGKLPENQRRWKKEMPGGIFNVKKKKKKKIQKEGEGVGKCQRKSKQNSPQWPRSKTDSKSMDKVLPAGVAMPSTVVLTGPLIMPLPQRGKSGIVRGSFPEILHFFNMVRCTFIRKGTFGKRTRKGDTPQKIVNRQRGIGGGLCGGNGSTQIGIGEGDSQP